MAQMRPKLPKPASKSSMAESEAPPTVSGKWSNLSLRDHGDVQTLTMSCTTGKSTTLSRAAKLRNFSSFSTD